ncbi:MAG: 4-(cytidine 5'-diphospho)-2-C-methyl-D-erythritol kinase [Pseudomonadales bacterium]
MISSITLRAPAKINLFLHITGRREDGYHNLQTAFQFLDVSDTLQFSLNDASPPAENIVLSGDTNDIALDDNLIYRAARALKAETGCTQGASINIKKRLPMGGGIGGGSSDAASTLLALNTLWQTGLSLEQLAQIGVQLGADVPVFVQGHAAFAEGVGEQLQPIEPAEPWYLLLKPDCSVSTGEIFSKQELTRNTSPIRIAAFLSGVACTRNDCQPVVEKYYPQVGEAMAWLSSHSKPYLTGTGACIFAAFETEQAAQSVQECMPGAWQGFVAQGRNRSPAHDDLATYVLARNRL